MNRRALLSAIAALPFLGRFASARDGVALMSAAHPVGRLHEGDISSDVLIEADGYAHLHVYATAGEEVTCENGHVICEFMCTVCVGEPQDVANHFGNWRQEIPSPGTIPRCEACGAEFTKGLIYQLA